MVNTYIVQTTCLQVVFGINFGIVFLNLTIILLITTTPYFANSVDPDHKSSDLDLHHLSCSL